jgi:hypothetical protein
MNKPELFHKTVKILVGAYLNDTLKHGSCHACAVANILMPIAEEIKVSPACWSIKFVTITKEHNDGTETHQQFIAGEGQYVGRTFWGAKVKDLAEAVGESFKRYHEAEKLFRVSPYTEKELSKIEHAFEVAPKGNCDDQWMFNGLMAVIDALQEIHGCTEQEAKEAKLLFVK